MKFAEMEITKLNDVITTSTSSSTGSESSSISEEEEGCVTVPGVIGDV